MKTFTNTHTLLYHTNDSISIPLRYFIIEGTTWFIGKDVAAICGYKDTWRAIKIMFHLRIPIILFLIPVNLSSSIMQDSKR